MPHRSRWTALTPDEIKAQLAREGITHSDFARIIGVTRRMAGLYLASHAGADGTLVRSIPIDPINPTHPRRNRNAETVFYGRAIRGGGQSRSSVAAVLLDQFGALALERRGFISSSDAGQQGCDAFSSRLRPCRLHVLKLWQL